jgi:hypothetical protein
MGWTNKKSWFDSRQVKDIFIPNAQDSSEGHPLSYSMSTGSFISLGRMARSKRRRLTSAYCQGQESMSLIQLHGMIFNYGTGFDSRQAQKPFLFLSVSKPVLETIRLIIYWIMGGGYFSGNKTAGA